VRRQARVLIELLLVLLVLLVVLLLHQSGRH
jgi:hypothetical protein